MDEVARYLKALGLNITEVTEDELASGDLDKYDTIFTGIRAYLAREDLNTHNDKLLEYAHNGGNLVVQHNLPGDWDANHTPPYPLTRSEEHTSELQSRGHLVCRLLLEHN